MLGGIFNRLRDLIENPVPAVLSLVAILIALSFHEWGHAYAAYKLGDPTARNFGRLTINPVKHVDIIGLLCLFVFGFGWAKPVPVNPRNFKNYRRDDIIVSLAGVSMNFLLSIVALLAFGVLFLLTVDNLYIYYFVAFFCRINLVLMVFNLIPIYPLDGSHVLESLLIRRVGPSPFLFLKQYGQLILLALIVLGITSTIIGTVVGWLQNLLILLFSPLFGAEALPFMQMFL